MEIASAGVPQVLSPVVAATAGLGPPQPGLEVARLLKAAAQQLPSMTSTGSVLGQASRGPPRLEAREK